MTGKQRYRDVVRTKGAVGPMLVLAVCAALGACTSAPMDPSAPADAASGAQPQDHEQRLRALQQAEALYLSGHLKEAQAAFEGLTRTYPRNAEVWFRLGNTLMREGNYDDAAVALQNALSIDPGHGRAALNLALARLAQAQAAIEVAHTRLEADSPQRQQADELQRRIRTLLAAPGEEAPSR
jgi:tetratricopeptide (TPR) repeat protein